MKQFYLAFIIGLGFSTVSCSKKVNVQVAGSSDDRLGEGEFPPTAVAIKNYDQVNATFSVMTGVPTNHTPVENLFNEVKASMLVTNDLVTMGPSVQLAIFKLAQVYCREATLSTTLRNAENVELRRVLYPSYPFFGQSPNPTQAFNQTANLKVEIIRGLVSKLWGPGVSAQPDAEAELLALFDELIAGVPANENNNQQTMSILWGMCSAVLSASPTVIF
jgi:hypothetical protein